MGALPKLEDCNPGVEAVGFRIVVAMEDTEKTTKGGIILPDSAADKNDMVAVRGRIVSVGSVAFDYADFPAGSVPRPGDAIMFAKLAGYVFTGADDRKYRIMHDKDVSAVLLEEPKVVGDEPPIFASPEWHASWGKETIGGLVPPDALPEGSTREGHMVRVDLEHVPGTPNKTPTSICDGSRFGGFLQGWGIAPTPIAKEAL